MGITKQNDKIGYSFDNRPKARCALSFVVITYNNGKGLLECLKSIGEQSGSDYEVIVVDNGRTDKRYMDRIREYKILYVKLKENFGSSVGKNIGMCYSRTENLAFIDDDAIIERDYAEKAIDFFRNPKYYGFRGKIKFKTNSIYNYLQRHYDLGKDSFPYFLDIEGNTALRKRYLSDIGGWPESREYLTAYGTYRGALLSYKLVSKFGREGLLYFPDAVIYHDYSHSFPKLIKKDLRRDVVYAKARQAFPWLYAFIESYSTGKKFTAYDLSTWRRLRLNAVSRARNFIRRTLKDRPSVQRFVFEFWYADKSAAVLRFRNSIMQKLFR